ncbi:MULTISPECIES: hypothetical protein [unclassified Streptomyces]|uniref:hypothetical protein n=1 Tax=unclassified Streptomyces TaxID=2593676 RepID=UPI0013A70CA6|nr:MULTISPECIES: hypothetical protein [unclassified Streptomyces]
MDLRIFTAPQQGASYDTLLSVAKATEMPTVEGGERLTEIPRRPASESADG